MSSEKVNGRTKALDRGRRRLSYSRAMPRRILLAVIGWVVAFLLGKEMSTGYSLWHERRAEQRADETDPEGPRRA